ncbi:MAG: Ig-like domain-containing protein [Pyrinomonadaceae bacterium]
MKVNPTLLIVVLLFSITGYSQSARGQVFAGRAGQESLRAGALRLSDSAVAAPDSSGGHESVAAGDGAATTAAAAVRPASSTDTPDAAVVASGEQASSTKTLEAPHSDATRPDLVGDYLKVVSGAAPPLSLAAYTGEVVITAPTAASSYRIPVDIPVTATVSSVVGVVARVDFYANGALIGTDLSAPYGITWANAGAGVTVTTAFSLTAIATNVSNVSYTSAAVSVTIKPPFATGAPALPSSCKVADIVAFDQVFYYNRLGAVNPAGMIYALRRDVVPVETSKGLIAGNVQLRQGKRPRPIVLRMNVGDCLRIKFQNLLAPDEGSDDTAEGDCLTHANPQTPEQKRRCDQPRTRAASAHVQGLQLGQSILDDGSFVGVNPSSLVEPGEATTYTYYADKEGPYVMSSTAATTGGEGDGGSISNGLFGVVNVETQGAEYYRSQITYQEMQWASHGERWPALPGQPIGHPKIDYNAVYPVGHPFAGKPILKMLNGSEIFHTDLNAIITGPNHGRFTGAGAYRPVKVEPDRNQPFREFTVVYHDEIVAVQAFPQFNDDESNPNRELAHTLHSVKDGFAINYGTGGIGAEILANRFGVGPMRDCVDCNFEEFFLSAWASGDPAMVVDVPANTLDSNGNLQPGAKANVAFFPDDPSNVHHTYINDHTKFRVVHAGSKEHHIHHLHAHQWLHSPDDDNSTYLDSQAIGPGSTFTMEIAYNGSGNRNKTVGDSIFHCHFYPHFAQGMWELWRSHDVFEEGTQLNGFGQPQPGARALPDGEISAGTPIPALVPIPTIAMAPMPSAVHIENGQVCFGTSQPCNRTGNGVTLNPGYPFFVAAVAGHRPPHPPLDTEFAAGLPRHVIVGGTAVHHKEKLPNFDLNKARLDFDKGLETAVAQEVAETGSPIELVAMAYHAVRNHPSIKPEDGTAASFVTNGRPQVPGAPYADPCIDDNGQPWIERLIDYRAAAFQFDIKLNKAGWHFPQQRILALWADVAPTISGARAPEPLFFRGNTGDCLVFHHANLIPRVYKLDDFQVRTPTDVVGQHIHLVKFDVTSSDGAGNGWNYEDGTFSPDEVRERIDAINNGPNHGILPAGGGSPVSLTIEEHPVLHVSGAQTTVQRWLVDDILNNNEKDRTMRTVFTHDHFGPSTHQQVGLYAGLVVEPRGSVWKQQETGDELRGRFDGGPTSWRADIIPPDNTKSFREFLLEFADFQHAYREGGGGTEAHPVPDPEKVVNPPAKKEAAFQPPFILLEKLNVCPNSNAAPPCPEAISAADVGTMVVNYRNEPIPQRIWNFNGSGSEPGTQSFPQQAAGDQGDLAYVYRSNLTRADQRFNVQPTFYPPLTPNVAPGDPFTPVMRAYEDDRVQVRVLVGAHEEGHNFSVNGVKWFFEPGTPDDPLFVNNSGYRNSQMMGISEHFEFVVPPLPMPDQNPATPPPPFYDFRYAPGHGVDDQWNGMWGILRAFRGSHPPTTNGNGTASLETEAVTDIEQPVLQPLPNNPDGRAEPGTATSRALNANAPGESTAGQAVCPTGAPSRLWNVSAYLARDLLDDGTLVYNKRTNTGGRLEDPTAIMYVRNDDINPSTGKLKLMFQPEPLVLRALAGECITVNLTNKIPEAIDLPGHNTLPMIVDNFNANQIKPSSKVGLHPQLMFYDVTQSDGMNVGFNKIQTAAYNETVQYRWYAGDLKVDGGTPTYTPIEFGATNLMPADPIKHTNKGAIGALIIEPSDTYVMGDMSLANGLVSHADVSISFNPYRTSMRELVLMFQNDINLRFGERIDPWGHLRAVPNIADEDDPEDTGQKALNYRTEPMWKRLGYEPDEQFSETRKHIFTKSLANEQIGGADPETPVFLTSRSTPVRFRVLHPGGHSRNSTFILHGHEWQEEPYANFSRQIGNNPLSEWKGVQHGHGPSNHFDVDLRVTGAGGRQRVIGDYLYRDRATFTFDGGLWGIFRVQ